MTDAARARHGLELWGGIECTVNRVGDAFLDQTMATGHHDRPGDLARFAGLGIKTLRYPFLWERIAPGRRGEHDWSWTDARVAELDRLGIAPIAGLVHHGSGPAYTSLIDPAFPRLLADFAAAVAMRYPHIKAWTPVNEPLTTARFSALYGHWYPHARDEAMFWTALLHQVEGTQAAMQAIREHIPDALLIQTEDVGTTYANSEREDIAAFHNERRWATWDLLTGRVRKGHALCEPLARIGLADRAAAIACPPDLIGINHYVTSDRCLTEQGDVDAVRAVDPAPGGLAEAIAATWQRYALPMAITECHLGCTREEQMRWLWQCWLTASTARDTGVDLRALTVWALLGSHDWSSLLTQARGHYESGPFEVASGSAQPTALAGVVRALAKAEPLPAVAAQLVNGAGWWQRPMRITQPPLHVMTPDRRVLPPVAAGRPVLVTGATGTLGRAFAEFCDIRGLACLLTDRATLDLEDEASIERVLAQHQPWAVVNAAGWVRVDEAEDAPEACLAANTHGAAKLARICAGAAVPVVAFSSDLVFDGRRDGCYDEDDAPAPLGVYGRSKAEAEVAILTAHPGALVVRTAAFFSPSDPYNFAVAVEDALRRGRRFGAVRGYVITPAYVPDLVHATLDLLIDGVTGIRHLTNQDPVDWLTFARRIAGALALDASLIDAIEVTETGWRAMRPVNAALGSRHGRVLPRLDDALARHAWKRERRAMTMV